MRIAVLAVALPLTLFVIGVVIGLSAAFLPLQVTLVCALAFLFAAGGFMAAAVHRLEDWA